MFTSQDWVFQLFFEERSQPDEIFMQLFHIKLTLSRHLSVYLRDWTCLQFQDWGEQGGAQIDGNLSQGLSEPRLQLQIAGNNTKYQGFECHSGCLQRLARGRPPGSRCWSSRQTGLFFFSWPFKLAPENFHLPLPLQMCASSRDIIVVPTAPIYIYKYCFYLESSTQEDKEIKCFKRSWQPAAKKNKHSENV